MYISGFAQNCPGLSLLLPQGAQVDNNLVLSGSNVIPFSCMIKMCPNGLTPQGGMATCANGLWTFIGDCK